MCACPSCIDEGWADQVTKSPSDLEFSDLIPYEFGTVHGIVCTTPDGRRQAAKIPFMRSLITDAMVEDAKKALISWYMDTK